MTTTTAKHTPGPWRLSDRGADGEHAVIRAANDYEIATIIELVGLNADQAAANASLIAAAPELLEELRHCETALRWAAQEAAGKVRREIVDGWLYHADRAHEAIAKATGDA